MTRDRWKGSSQQEEAHLPVQPALNKQQQNGIDHSKDAVVGEQRNGDAKTQKLQELEMTREERRTPMRAQASPFAQQAVKETEPEGPPS